MIKKSLIYLASIALIALYGCSTTKSAESAEPSNYYTRGIGQYPGLPSEDFAPTTSPDKEQYRNIALRRAAYHSSCYDYNLTAQLVTDGIITSEEPRYMSVTSHEGPLPRREREWGIDNGKHSRNKLKGENTWLQYSLHNYTERVDELRMRLIIAYDKERVRDGYDIRFEGSTDGSRWQELARFAGKGLPGKEHRQVQHIDPNTRTEITTYNTRSLTDSLHLHNVADYAHYRLRFNMPGAVEWSLRSADLFLEGKPQNIASSKYFDSAWMSEGADEEWIYVDLGSHSTFDRVRLHWIDKALSGDIEVSDDATTWRSIASLPSGNAMLDDIACTGEGRYLRVRMRQPANGTHYTLSEIEIMGRGGAVAHAAARPAAEGSRLSLAGGGWQLQRALEVTASGEELSQTGFSTNGWLTATVPATVLSSYIRAGAVPDPNRANNIFQISESYFNSDFWYRTEFELPEGFAKERIFLNFDGVNWKAEIYLNGTKVGRIDGAFIRGLFDISKLAKMGRNTLAVRIIKNENIGFVKEKCTTDTDKNGGTLGADNPTFHASVGWDWISTIRGRNIGIYNDVYITTTGDITLHDPLVQTLLALPDTTATLTPKIILRNHSSRDVEGLLKGYVGDIKFEQKVRLAAGAERVARFEPAHFTQLRNQDLQLWWPKGYGKPHLYDAGFSFEIDGKVSDTKEFKVGVRQMSHKYEGEALVLYINGRRFIGRGGNWGFSENNLNYRGREYNIAVAYNAAMNFTMMRNWVGQIGDEELYEACDRHGIMIWQDFWLANPSNGPDPHDNQMFLANATDYVRRIRHHASIALYCGRNEGFPPKELDEGLRNIVAAEHPDIHYISHSSRQGVSGHGPYRALPAREYFEMDKGRTTFHSERGMPCMVNYESLQRMLDEKELWPQGDGWGKHDFTTKGAQRVTSFNAMVEKGFGTPQSAKEFCELAQWINYDGYRAIFESRSSHRKGMLLWMAHPAWPSMVWQTYDYYFEPTAAYFGCMKGNEPLHIQWNAATDEVEVVNYSAGRHTALQAKAQLINLDGSVAWERSCELSSDEDTTTNCFKIEFPTTLSSAHFVKLTLSKGENILSDNFYIRGTEEGNYQAIRTMPKVELHTDFSTSRTDEEWHGLAVVRNTSNTPALMIRLNLVGAADGEQILPVFYSDNYFALMPGEERTINLRWSDRDTRGCTPQLTVTGYNVK